MATTEMLSRAGVEDNDSARRELEEMGPPAPEQIAEIIGWMRKHRPADSPFDVVIEGVSPPNDPAWTENTLQPLADAGATWWIESRWEAPNDIETLRHRIRQGPPRLPDGAISR